MEVSCESYHFATPHYALSVVLRDKILREPLGLTFNAEDLSKEWDSIHLGAFNEHDELCACLVLVPISEKEIKMRQVAVAEELQGNGIGKKLVSYSELFAKSKGFSKMVLNARQEAVSFYKKLDYHIEGNEFMEVGIPHFKMTKTIG